MEKYKFKGHGTLEHQGLKHGDIYNLLLQRFPNDEHRKCEVWVKVFDKDDETFLIRQVQYLNEHEFQSCWEWVPQKEDLERLTVSQSDIRKLQLDAMSKVLLHTLTCSLCVKWGECVGYLANPIDPEISRLTFFPCFDAKCAHCKGGCDEC